MGQAEGKTSRVARRAAFDHSQGDRRVWANAPTGILIGAASGDAHHIDVDRLGEIGFDARNRAHGAVNHRELQAAAQDPIGGFFGGGGWVFDCHPQVAHCRFGQIEDHHSLSLAGFVREVNGQEVEFERQGLGNAVDGLGKLIADPVP